MVGEREITSLNSKLKMGNSLWSVIIVAMGIAWFFHCVDNWMEKLHLRQELRLYDEELQRLRSTKNLDQP